ncbi:MAG: HypC/HybG/HupF family hydrogenase formation chaperone [Chloroflexi bacterium]|nr:HypC/HybG/HupF family hydrogenase formation chaperone [Chloroflexota bacterium]
MCLGIPARIIAIGEGLRAEVELGGILREADLTLVPEARVGDYVLVHVGYAIQRIDEAVARETLELLREMALAEDEAQR